jgi:SAM-dependent methyltransferase
MIRQGEDRKALRPCPICHGAHVDVLHHQSFVLTENHPLADGYDVVSCVACGFVYADTAVTQRAYDRFYADSSKYADVQTGTGGGDLPWDDKRLEETAREIARLVPEVDAQIVDVGCANGGLLKWLSRLGRRRLVGVDPALACVRAAERFPGVTGMVGTLFELPSDIQNADCVILSHVLEHVRDLEPALRQLFDKLRVGGLLYVEVPDATRYADYVTAPLQDFNTEHINHFSLRSLRNLLEANGFEVRHEGQKTIEASAGVPYPALWIMAERCSAPVPRAAALPVRDSALRDSIERYIERSLSQISAIDAHLASELTNVDQIVVWGAGQTILKLLAVSRLARANIAAFVDTNPMLHGKHLRGAPIVAPEALSALPQPILIGSLISQEPIARRIRELGLPNRVLFLQS